MPYDRILFANGAESTLAATLAGSAAATSLTLATGDGTKFPATPSAGDYFVVTLTNAALQSEIVKCTGRAGDVLTVVRGWESSTIYAFAIGDSAAITVTAGTLNTLQSVGWTREYDAVTYVGATSFKVANDHTAIYGANRVLRLTQTTPGTGTVSSSSYATGYTTVVVTGLAVDSGITGVDYGPETSLFGAAGPSGAQGTSGNAALDYDASTGTVTNYTAAGQLVRKMVAADGGTLTKYIVATAASQSIIGIAVSSTSVLRRGEVQISGKTWTMGNRLYVNTDGTITEVFSSAAQCIGVAIATDTIRFEPDMGVVPANTFANWTHSHSLSDLPATMPPSAHTHAVATATKTTAYTVVATDDVILCDATTASFAVTLPLASAAQLRLINIKKTDSTANTVTVTCAGSDTLDGATTYVIAKQYANLTIVTNGTNWFIL